jgi:signal transduction histidine kinase/DNA-binding response OmpR family regulator
MLNLHINRLLHFDSIKKKLIFFMTALSIISVLIGVIGSAVYSIGDMRRSITSKMETTTAIVGSMSEGALLFADQVTARETLSVLTSEREIVMACLYQTDNNVLGQYIAAGAENIVPSQCPSTPEATVGAHADVYTFRHAIRDSNGELAGTILVVAHLVTLQDLISKQIWITVIIVLLVSIVALGVSYVLQPLITGPILQLMRLTKRISEEKDYSLRANINSDDEVGVLSSSFNAMLATIQDREKELYEINEKAEAASRSKSEFLANMSHEIRTPINGILGFAQLLSVMPLEEKQRSFVDIILSSGNTLLTVINDILDFSKIEAGKLHIEAVPFDLGHVIENVINIMTAKAEEKKLELVMRYAPGTPSYVIGDPGRVKQVLINYIGNAIKFTEKGHVMINVEARILGNTETIIRFEVIDTGIGISKAAQKQIFEKFMQADASTTKRYGGTGLGLAISQQLAHLMGGEVGVSSEEGKGSNFWFEVPFRLDQNQEQKRNLPEVDLTGCHLLVVDDHEVNRRILLELAEGWNVRAAAAESGEEALVMLKKAKAADDPYHIAILDYQLPNMDGEDLSNLIKTDRELATTSLILLTSMGMRGDAGKFQEIGFDAYLVKPARAAVLLDTVSTVWMNRDKGAAGDGIITQHTFATDSNRRAETGSPHDRQLRDVEVISSPDAPVYSDAAMPVNPAVAADPPAPPPAPPAPPAQPPAPPAQPAVPQKPQEQSLEQRMRAAVGAPSAPPRTTAAAKPAGGPRILLVEDQLTNRLVVENILENMGLTTFHAENGQEAVERVKSESFDLILMDVQMPVMNGYDATRAIRQIEASQQRAHMPIVAVTANAMQGDREKCLDAGMDEYISKPIQVPELQAMIERYLGIKSA